MPDTFEFSERREHTIYDPTRSALPIPATDIVDELRINNRKIGYAFGIAGPEGIWMQQHKANPRQNIADGEWGVPSETVLGRFQNGIVTDIESFEECMRRCFIEEQGFDVNDAPTDAQFLITRSMPISAIRWHMSHDVDRTIPNQTYGLALAVNANESMAQFMKENAQETMEAYPGSFQPLDVLRSFVKKRIMRPGFDAWLIDYEASAEASAGLGPKQHLILPRVPLVSGDGWRSLRMMPERRADAIQLLICDGDGTLVDSDEQVFDVTYAMVQELGEHTTREQIMELYASGEGAKNMLQKAAPNHDLETIMDRFYYHDERIGYDKVTLMPGVEMALETLHKKMYIGICTERALPSTLRMFGHVGLLNEERFGIAEENIVAPPEFTPKSKGIHHLLQKFGVNARNAVMFGNHVIDINEGRKAGVHTVGTTDEPDTHRQLIRARATDLVPSMARLPSTLILLEDLM